VRLQLAIGLPAAAPQVVVQPAGNTPVAEK
jgi:hypothetical protein